VANAGARELVDPALARRLVDLVPEYEGSALTFLAGARRCPVRVRRGGGRRRDRRPGGLGLAGSTRSAGRWIRPTAAFAWLTVLVVIVVPLARPAPTGLRAEVTLHQTRPAPDRWVTATVRLSDPHAADGANWFDFTSWQGAGSGDGGLVIDRLRPAGEGEFVSTTSFPVDGKWKSLLRLHVGSELAALPIYLPADPGIPALAAAAFPNLTRTFEPDHQLLMREAVGGSTLISRSAYIAFAVVMTMWIAAMAWGFARVGRASDVLGGAETEHRRPVSAAA